MTGAATSQPSGPPAAVQRQAVARAAPTWQEAPPAATELQESNPFSHQLQMLDCEARVQQLQPEQGLELHLQRQEPDREALEQKQQLQ